MTQLDSGHSAWRVDPSSYVDPHGFVFHTDRGIFRAIFKESADFYRRMISDGIAQRLHERFGLVRTELSELYLADVGCDLVVQHEVVEPATYCVEWCPSMLRDAARLHLELSIELASQHMMLQDASPWNVRFQGTRPRFIDFTSIVPTQARLLWPAYSQFQSFFMRPLHLAAINKGKVGRALLYDTINGITLQDFVTNVGLGYLLRHSYLAITPFLDRLLQTNRKLKKAVRELAAGQGSEIDVAVRKRFFRGLLKRLERLEFSGVKDAWSNYYVQVEPGIDKQRKLSTVRELLIRLQPPTVVDLGCNTGAFSVLAAECGARVISLDKSEACIAHLYAYAKRQGLDILPLVVDLLAPTPPCGFLGNQYPGVIERARSHMVFCLGLMHHLYINGRQSLDRIAFLLSQLGTQFAIFEYIDQRDSNIDLLETVRPIRYSLADVKQALGRYFRTIQEYDSDRPTRRILLCGHA